MKKTLVLFDFDGTITTKDTFPLFILFAKGKLNTIFIFLLYSPIIFLFLCKLITAENLKRKLLKFCFGGKTKQEMQKLGEEFINELYEKNIIKKEFVRKINEYKATGAEICIVSASIDTWLYPFCKNEDIGLLCTELKYIEDVFNGKFNTPNCNDEEKARRIKARFSLKEYETIIAYGNSKSDYPMFSLANKVQKV